jgi:hypothetical protein
MKKLIWLCLLVVSFSAHAELICDDAYLAQFDNSQIQVSDLPDDFKKVEILSSLSFMGMSLAAGTEVKIFNQSIYSMRLVEDMEVQGYPVSRNGKVGFDQKSNTIVKFILSKNKSIDGQDIPAGSEVSLYSEPKQLRNGNMAKLRHIKLGGSASIQGKSYSSGDKILFNPLTGAARKIKR